MVRALSRSTSLVLALIAFLPAVAHATDVNWLGTTSTAWATATNWSALPANDLVTDRAVFAQASYTNQPNAGTTSIAGLSVGTSAAVTITSTNLSIGGNGIDMSAATNNLTLGAAAGNIFTIGASQNWNVASGRTLTGTGIVAMGTNRITLNGAGTVTLSGVNTSGAAGGITLNSGTLNINNASALGNNTGSSFIIAGGTINNSTAAAITIGTAIPMNWNGNFTFTGTQSLNLAAGAVVMNAARTITVTANTLTVGGGITGATFGITKAGAGTLVLSGVIGTTTGGLTVNAGTLQVNGANTFTGAVTVNSGGTIQFGGTGNVLGTTAGITTIASGGSLNVNGIANTSTEPVTINGTGISSGGAIRNSSGTAGSFAGPITLATASSIVTPAGSLTLSGAINLGANTLTVSGTTGRFTASGLISGAGGVIVGSYTTGDYNPQSQNTYSGGTIFNAGSVSPVSSNTVGPAGAPTSGNYGTGTLTFNGGQMRSGTGGPFTIGNTSILAGDFGFYTIAGERSLTLSGPMTITGATRTLTSAVGTTVAGTTAQISGAIGDGGSGFGITKAGAGNLVLSGNNTYLGPTTVSAGSLYIRGSQAPNTDFTTAAGTTLSLLSGTLNPLNAITTLNLGAGTTIGLDVGANSATSDRLVAANPATVGAVTFNLSALSGIAPGAFDLISAPSGLLAGTYSLGNVAGGFNYALSNTDSAVTVTLTASPNATGNLYWRGAVNASWSVYNGGTTNFTTDAAGLANAGSVPGPGNTVIFSAANAPFTATTVITTTLDNLVKINDLQFTSNPAGITAVTISAGTTIGAALEIGPSNTTAGISLAANAGAVVLAAPVVLSASQTWTVDATSTLTVSGGISGPAGSALSISGLVTLSTINGSSSTYSGATTIPSGSVLSAGAANAFSPNSPVTVSGTGILRINGFAASIGALSGDGVVHNNTTTAATLTLGNDNGNADFSGTIVNGSTAAINIAKAGTGTQILSGANTYTGTTTVNGGILRFSGSMGSTAVTVNTGGTVQIGTTTGLTSANAVTLAGTGTFDLFGNDVTIGALTSATTNTITNSGSGSGTNTLTLGVAGATVNSLITDGATRKTQVLVTNANTNTLIFNNSLNTFSGGIILGNSAAGTRMSVIAALTQVATQGNITSSPFGRGPIILGQSPTDKASLFFATVTGQTVFNDIVFNTSLGTDRFGIRSDVAGTTLAGVITANEDATFSANNTSTGSITLTNRVTGPGGLVIDLSQTTTGAATLNIILNNTTANPNDYAGDTFIGRTAASPTLNLTAQLTLGANDQIPNGSGAGNLIVNNATAARTGTFRLNGFNDTINGLSGNGFVDGLSGTPTLTFGDNNATATFSGVIRNTAGTLNLVKIGSGIQTLSGTNTFSGSLSINAGAVEFAASANLGDASATNVINLNGGTLRYTGGGAVGIGAARVVTLGVTGGTLEASNSTGALTIDGGINPASVGNLTKTGPGTVIVTGPISINGGSGSAFVTNGTLQGSFGTSGITNLIVGPTGSMQFNNGTAEVLTLNAGGVLSLANGARLGLELGAVGTNDQIVVPTTATNTGTITLDFYNLGGGLAAGTYNLLSATGGLNSASYLLGTAPNGFNYTINSTPTSVTLDVTAFIPIYWSGAASSFTWNDAANWANDVGGTPAGVVPTALKTVIFSTTAAPFSSGTEIATTLDAPFTIDSIQFTALPAGITSVRVNPGTGGALTLAPISTSGGILVTDNAGAVTIAAPLTIAAGQTWNISNTAASLAITGNTAFNAAVNKTGAGAVSLSGVNSGSSTFTLTSGQLNINSSTALGNTSLVIAPGTTIDTNDAVNTNVTVTSSNAQTWNGNFTFAGTFSLTFSGGAVTLGNSLTLTTNANTLRIAGAIGDGGNARSLTKAGAGNLQLDGANTYSGGTTLSAGVIGIGNVAALGTGAITFNGGSFDNLIGTPATLAGSLPLNFTGNATFLGTNSLNLGSGPVTLTVTPTVTVSNNTLTIGGSITGTGGINKTGSGTLTLGGTGTYSGSTTVTNGTLNVSDAITAGSLIVGNGGTFPATVNLAGSYTTTGGNVTIGNSGTVVGIANVGAGASLVAANFGGGGGGLLFASATNAVGVLNQTGGSVSADTFILGNSSTGPNASYAMYNMSGGTFINNNSATTSRFRIANASASTVGLFYLSNDALAIFSPVAGSGGSNTLELASSGSASTTGGNPIGVLYITGTGHLLSNAPGNLSIGNTINTTVASIATGQMTIGGAGSTNARVTVLGIATSSGTAGAGNQGNSTINILSGGTLTTGSITKAANGTSYVNFDGGTLKVGTNATTFGAQTGVFINAGGATIDTNGFATYTIAAPLLAPSGFGLTSLSTATAGAGYVGAPAVLVSGGSGVGATAIAQVSGGVVSSIVVTNPGSGYADTDVLTVTLTGGGASTPATVNSTTAGNFAVNASGGLTKVGLGTLILSGNSTYTGPTVISAGSLTLGAGGTTGALSPSSAITLNTGSVFTINRSNAVTQGIDFSAGDINLGAFTQAGAGTTTFITNNTYPGVTTITAGGLQLSDGVTNGGTTGGVGTGAITLTGGSLIFNRTDTYPLLATNLVTGAGSVVLGNTGTVATVVDGQFTTTGGLIFGTAINSTIVSTLDLTNGSSSFGLATVRTDNTVPNTIILPAGKSLTVTGMTLGVANATANITDSNLTFVGAGSLTVNGTITLGLAAGTADNAAFASFATLDLTSLGSVTNTATALNIGNNRSSAGTLLLSNTANTITATTVTVGHSQGNNGSGVTSFLTFGTGTNVLRADTINVGFSKISGTINFASQAAGSLGSVTITNVAGTGGANITLGSNNGTGTAAVFTGTLDLRGHNATVTTGTLNLGIGANTNTGSVTGVIHFDTGSFTVTGATILGAKSGTGGSGTATGTINVSGGTFTVAATAGTFVLSSNTAATGAGRGNFNLTGGTATFNIDITKVGGTNTIGTVTLDGGTLEMTGKAIGSAAQTIVFNAQSGTLQNLGELNGGGILTKSGAGILVLAGTNTYTGTTTVSSGVLQVTGTTAGGAVNVDSNGTLRGTGTIGGATTVNTGGTIRGGNTVGTLNLSNGLTVASGGVVAVVIADGTTSAAFGTGGSTTGTLPANPTSNNYLNITNGGATFDANSLFTFDATGVVFNYLQPYSYKIAEGAGDQSALNLGAANITPIGVDVFPDVSITGTAGGAVYLNFVPIPEPTLMLVLAGLAGLASRRRRCAG